MTTPATCNAPTSYGVCGRPARDGRTCGLHSPRQRALRADNATRQWAGKRLRDANESAAALLHAGKFNWCRARLLAALASASQQGVLDEVLAELAPDDEGLADRLRTALTSNGWPADRRPLLETSRNEDT
jgi:hypothetical protein